MNNITEDTLLALDKKLSTDADVIRAQIKKLEADLQAVELQKEVCAGAIQGARDAGRLVQAVEQVVDAPVQIAPAPTTERRRGYTRHTQATLDPKIYRVVCPSCGHRSRYPSQFRTHVKRSHEGREEEVLRLFEEARQLPPAAAAAADPPVEPVALAVAVAEPVDVVDAEEVERRRRAPRTFIATCVAEERLVMVYTKAIMLGADLENGKLRDKAQGFRYAEAMYALKLVSILPDQLQYVIGQCWRQRGRRNAWRFRLSRHIGQAIWTRKCRKPTSDMEPIANRVAGYLAKLLARYMPDLQFFKDEPPVENVYAEAERRYREAPITCAIVGVFKKGSDAGNTLADFGERLLAQIEREEIREIRGAASLSRRSAWPNYKQKAPPFPAGPL